ncbi:MAG: STAS domain-containing protein [Magnetococcales bacterium]|nr:STAS domain-containing protein [Magnetococcales bacterium]NGZ04797.1 STAS domain-containing protein [Magnetococcales bacterium]
MNTSTATGKVVVKRSSSEVRIAVKGPFNHALRQQFRESYYSYPANTHYIVDFSDVTMMDSSAMGMLIQLRKHAGDDKAEISLVNLSPRLSGLIKASGMSTLFDLF